MAGHQQSQTFSPPIHTCKKKVCGLCNNVRLLPCTFWTQEVASVSRWKPAKKHIQHIDSSEIIIKKKVISKHMSLRFLLNLSLNPAPVKAAVRPKSAGGVRKPWKLSQPPFEKQLLRDIKTYEGRSPVLSEQLEVNQGSGFSPLAGCSAGVQLRSALDDWKVSPSGSCRGFKTL